MEKIKQYFEEVKDYYYIDEKGNVINIKNNTVLKPYYYKLMREDKKNQNYSIKTLYKKIYNKEFCNDNIENLEGEEWKEIEGTNQLYYCSTKGRIKSYYKLNAEILKPIENEKGYLKVFLYINGKKVSKFVHRLVVETFKGKAPNETYQVHHLDKLKKNNNVLNLCWVSISDHFKIHNKKENYNENSTKSKIDNKN